MLTLGTSQCHPFQYDANAASNLSKMLIRCLLLQAWYHARTNVRAFFLWQLLNNTAHANTVNLHRNQEKHETDPVHGETPRSWR